MNFITLNNGVRIPQLGLGTWMFPDNDVAQLCIQYTLQLGAISLPKSASPDHIRTNAQLDFTIDEADMQQLVDLKQDYERDARFPVFGKAPK